MSAVPQPVPAGNPPPRLLDQVRQAALAHFGRTEPAERHVGWVRGFVLLHGKRHPRELGPAEVMRFREHVAHTDKDPLGSLEPAHAALTCLDELDLLDERTLADLQSARTANGALHARQRGVRTVDGEASPETT
ncbi:MAG: hypothetical protein JOY66_14630 [Acetobacteraceae bacterium]|nr:hypothetical protein [Acetobacteraceae bacterium]